MATVNQIEIAADSRVAGVVDRYLSDDWEFYWRFTSGGAAENMSAWTWSANLIREPGGVYTSTAITGANGAVDSTNAANGYVYVTVYDALTSTLTQDLDSMDIDTSTLSTFTHRLALIGTLGVVTKTWGIQPIRVIRR
jgi:hypothetical protein